MRSAQYEKKMKRLREWKKAKERKRLEKFLKWRKAMRDTKKEEWRGEAELCSN